LPVDHGAAIVGWLSQMTPDQRREAIAAEPVENWPTTLSRAYPGRSAQDVTARMNYEAALLYEAGYQVTNQMWGGGGATIGDFALYGLAGAALKTDTSALMVTYSRVAPSGGQPRVNVPLGETTRATKRCPDCAEEVMAEARVCRFCRHEFGPPSISTTSPNE